MAFKTFFCFAFDPSINCHPLDCYCLVEHWTFKITSNYFLFPYGKEGRCDRSVLLSLVPAQLVLLSPAAVKRLGLSQEESCHNPRRKTNKESSGQKSKWTS